MKHPEELTIHDWQGISEGDTIRVACSHYLCNGKKDAFTITRTLDGCVYNCYRCGTTGAIYLSSSPNRALQKLKGLQHGNINTSGKTRRVVLPMDFVSMVHHSRIPPNAYAWLYKYELDDNDIYNFNIGWSNRIQRVVIPVYSAVPPFKLVAWQGRDVFYDRNKLLFKRGIMKHAPIKYYTEVDTPIYNIKSTNQYQINKNKIYFNITNQLINNYIIIVEDILSAIKVHNKYTCSVVALLNSTITDTLVQQLKKYTKVYIWLDWDARVKAIKASRQFQSQGINAQTIRTRLDPKAVPYREMQPLC